MATKRLSIVAVLVALLGIAASTAADAGNCQTSCYRAGNQTNCQTNCY